MRPGTPYFWLASIFVQIDEKKTHFDVYDKDSEQLDKKTRQNHGQQKDTTKKSTKNWAKNVRKKNRQIRRQKFRKKIDIKGDKKLETNQHKRREKTDKNFSLYAINN